MTDPVIVSQPVPNLPLLRKVLDHIDAHPEEWDQGAWGLDLDQIGEETKQARSAMGMPICGTTFCIAGHAVAMTEGVVPGEWEGDLIPASGESWVDAGQRVLGLNAGEAIGLFSATNTRAGVQSAAEAIAARAGERL